MFLRSVIWGLVVWFISVESAAWNPAKECPALPKDSVTAQMTAGRLFNEAEQHYRESRPIEALKAFLCSFQIIQHENTLFNITQIAKLPQHRESVSGLLKDFVSMADSKTKMDPIRELIAELEDTIAKEQQAEAAPSETMPEVVATEPVKESKPVQALKPNTEPTLDSASLSKKNPLKIAGWAVFGVGAAAAVAGGVLQGLSAGAQGQAEESDTYRDFTDAKSRMEHLQTVAVIGFAAGGVCLASGLVLILSGRHLEKEEPTVSFNPGPGGVWMTGRF